MQRKRNYDQAELIDLSAYENLKKLSSITEQSQKRHTGLPFEKKWTLIKKSLELPSSVANRTNFIDALDRSINSRDITLEEAIHRLAAFDKEMVEMNTHGSCRLGNPHCSCCILPSTRDMLLTLGVLSPTEEHIGKFVPITVCHRIVI